MKPTELIIGMILKLDDENGAGWFAFRKKDHECDELKREIRRLKKILKDYKISI